MSLVVTQEGGSALWKQILQITELGVPNVHLFGSAHEPAHTDTYATYAAIELAVAGYAPIPLADPATDWSIAPIPAGAKATYVAITWVFTAACAVYGYWLADASDTYSIFAEQFAAPYVFPTAGGTFPIVLPPTITSTP